MRSVAVNDRWPVVLPEHRADRPTWATHEAARFDSMHAALAGTGAVLWDVGAELGDHAAVYASWGCRLVIIEPNPRAWPCIAATIQANRADGNVEAWCSSFVGDHADPAAITPDRFSIGPWTWPPTANGPCTGRAGMVHLDGRPDPDPYEHQPMTTIDALVAAGCPAPDAMTIDVEGAELAVLAGALATLDEHRPRLWVSVHPELLRGYGHSPEDVHRILNGVGYDGQLLAVDHEEHWTWVPS